MNSIFKYKININVAFLSILLFISFSLGFFSLWTYQNYGSIEEINNVDKSKIATFVLNGNKITIPLDDVLGIEGVIIDIDDSEISPVETNVLNENGKGIGMSVKSNSDKITSILNGNSPIIDFGGSLVNSGSFSYEAVLESVKKSDYILYILGSIFIAGGVILLFYAGKKLAFSLIVAGISLIGTAVLVTEYPWAILIGFFVVIGSMVYMIFIYAKEDKNKKEVKESFKTVVKAVDDVAKEDPFAAKKIKEAVTNNSGNKIIVRDQIREMKKEIVHDKEVL